MSALPPKADIGTRSWNVSFVPKADIAVVQWPTQIAQCFLFRVYGGTVLCIEGRSEIDGIQLASCRRPAVRSPSPRLLAISTATARISCAMPGGPCIRGSATRSSKKSAIRWARADSWVRAVGERSLSGRAISRPHTAIPSHMLRAANSSRRYARSDACAALWNRSGLRAKKRRVLLLRRVTGRLDLHGPAFSEGDVDQAIASAMSG